MGNELKIIKDDEQIIKKSDYKDFSDIVDIAKSHCKFIRCSCGKIKNNGYKCLNCGNSD